MVTCNECGVNPVFVQKTGECQKCYNARYYLEHRTLKPKRGRLGTTPELSIPCTYAGAHSRVRGVRGLPHEHKCIDCGAQAEEWAYRNSSPYEIQGWNVGTGGRGGKQHRRWSTWSPYVYDYDPMCHACHRERDAHLIPSTAGRSA